VRPLSSVCPGLAAAPLAAGHPTQDEQAAGQEQAGYEPDGVALAVLLALRAAAIHAPRHPERRELRT
jgi:hypothetical protein